MIRTPIAQDVLSSRATRVACFLFFCVFLLASPAHAQVITGTPSFGSFGGGPDVINLANLNAHLTIPVLSKPGRGLPFTFYLTYDSSIWYPVTSGSTTTWQNVPNWGWGGSEVNVGTVVSRIVSSSGGTCGSLPHLGTTFTIVYGWTYQDGFGTPHPFAQNSTVYTNSCTGGYTTGFTGAQATDDSGYSLSVNGSTVTSLYSADGSLISTTAGSIKDRNGNEITESGGVFTDTLGTTTLTIAGTAPNPVTYSYTAPSTGSAKYSVNYTQYTVATNFGLSTVHEFGAHSEPLPSSIALPDGSQYTFLYEATPLTPSSGACTPLSGTYQTNCVTGRVTRITLPTGGTINYSYVNGYNGILPDGSAATLQRVTPDGTWTYSQVKNTGAASTTTITDPSSAANQTVIQFQGIYETVRAVYQGSATSGTLLRTWFTCYNGESGNCPTTAIAPPISQRVVSDIYGLGGLQSMHQYFYDASGGLTEQLDYDYGSSGHGALLRTVVVTYAPLGNITAFQQTVTVCSGTGNNSACNGNGTVLAQSSYTYDQATLQSTSGITQHVAVTGSRGNLTSINYPVSGLTANFTYYDTGVPYTSQDVNGATTTYSYNSAADCDGAFPTSVSEPLSMSRAMTWNCTGGVQLTSVDENNQTTTTDWTDSYFWRPADVKFPDGGQTTWTYNSQTNISTTAKMNSSQNITTTQLFDGLGRNKELQLNSDPEGVAYQDTTYDALGRVYTTSNPYRTTGDPTYGVTTTIYDALGRPCVIIPPDGTSVSGSACPSSQPANDLFATYNGNSVTVTDQAGKTRTATYNSVGLLTQVLEDPGSSPHFNFETDYGYDALGDLLCVGQKGSTNSGSWSGCGSIPAGWSARTYVYDAMSRLTSETNPESGTVTYHYDANPNQGDLTSRVAPAPDQTGSNTVTTTYAYDALHRVKEKSYSDGTTTSAWFSYDAGGGWGITQNNVVGRIAEAWTGTSCCINGAAEIFSYDPMGRVVLNNQVTPAFSSGSIIYGYDLAGDMTSYSNGIGVNFAQSFDTAARPTSLTSSYVDANHPATLATADASVGYDPHGALRKINLGNNLTQTTAFNQDLQPCRINVNSAGTALSKCSDAIPSGNIQDHNYGFNLGTSNNGDVATWAGTGQQSFNRSYTYDSLNRLSTLSSPGDPNNCTGLSWGYDAWGNRKQQTQTGGTNCATFSQSVNAQNQLIGPPYAYDAAGNMTQDASHAYFYDAENRLIQVDGTQGTCSAATACYSYDALGRRSEKTTGSAKRDYIYDLSGNVIDEYCTNCSGYTGWSFGYVYFDGSLAAEYGGSTYFVHSDHLGSTRLLTSMGSDLIANPGFESGQTDWSGWSSNITLVNSSSLCHSGSYCSQISWNSSTGGPAIEGQTLAVQPGDVLTFGGWVNLQSGGGGALGWWIETQDSNHNALNWINAGSSPTTSGWQFQTTTYTVPSGVAYVFLYATVWQPNSSATILVDDGFLYDNRSSLQLVQNLDYLPFGELNSSDSDVNTHEFTGLEHDPETTASDLHHAMFRQYSPIIARWLTPDPAGLAAANRTNPQSWNRYSYAFNAPTAFVDSGGLCPLIVAGVNDTPENSPGILTYAQQIGADVAFPYADQSTLGAVGSVIAQDVGVANGAAQTTAAALQDAGSPAQNADGNNAVNVIAFSGGAQSTASAVNDLGNSNVNLTSAVYLEPGTGPLTGILGGLPTGSNQSAIVRGKGFLNGLLNSITKAHGIDVFHTNCGHSADCVFNQLSSNSGAVNPKNTEACTNPQIFARGRRPRPLGGGGGNGNLPSLTVLFLTYCGEGGCSTYIGGAWYSPGTWNGPTL